jgi:DDB1- and CUL4-associated factor 11
VTAPPPRPPRSRPRGFRSGRQWLAALDDDYDEDDSSLRKIKTVQGVEGRWTVTDADLSRDNEW